MKPCCRETVFFTFSLTVPGATSDKVEGWVVQWWGYSPPTNVVWVWIPNVMPRVSLLLVLALAPGSFSPGTPVSPLHKKATFPNSNFIRNIRQKALYGCATSESFFIIFIQFILMEFMLERVRCVVLRLPSPPPPTSLLFLCRVTVLATNLPVANEKGEWIWSSSWFVTSLRLHPVTELSWGFCRLWRRILCWFSVWMTLRQSEMNKVALHQLLQRRSVCLMTALLAR